MPSDDPLLQSGIGFHLNPDGSWKPEKIPPEVLKGAVFSGYLTINGYRSTVFNTKDGSSWAQKSSGTSALAVTAARVALKKSDIVSQVDEIFDDERSDTGYNQAIVEYADKALDALENLNDRFEDCLDEFHQVADLLGECEHDEISGVLAPRMRMAILNAIKSIRYTGENAIIGIIEELENLRDKASD